MLKHLGRRKSLKSTMFHCDSSVGAKFWQHISGWYPCSERRNVRAHGTLDLGQHVHFCTNTWPSTFCPQDCSAGGHSRGEDAYKSIWVCLSISSLTLVFISCEREGSSKTLLPRKTIALHHYPPLLFQLMCQCFANRRQYELGPIILSESLPRHRI